MELKEAKEILNNNGYILNESGYTIVFTDDRDIVRLDDIPNEDSKIFYDFFNETIMNMFKTLQTELEDDTRFKVEFGTQGHNNDEYYGSIDFKISNNSLPLVSYFYDSDLGRLIHLKLFDFEPQDDIKVTKNSYDEKMLVLQKTISAAPHTKSLKSVSDIKKIIENNIKIINSTLIK